MTRSKYASWQFWTDTFDRTLASLAQGLLGAAGLESTGVLDIEWPGVLSVGGSIALLSLLSSIAFRGKGTDLTGEWSDTPGAHALPITNGGQGGVGPEDV